MNVNRALFLKTVVILNFLLLSKVFAAVGQNLIVCDYAEASLKNLASINTVHFTKDELRNYKIKLERECELAKKFQYVTKSLNEKGLKATDINEYQALRFVQRSWYDNAVLSNKPVEKIYQLRKQDAEISVEQQSSQIWDSWAAGVVQLDKDVIQIKNGVPFTLQSLTRAHRGFFPFYPMIDEHGDFAHEPYPGVLKATTRKADAESESHWWILSKNEVESTMVKVEQINKNYRQLGILANAPSGSPSFVSNVLNVRMIQDRTTSEKIWAIYSGSNIMNRENIDRTLAVMNSLLDQARRGLPMTYKNRLFTPMELAFFIQQLYVRIHPFYEGNGRTSRYLQELILLSFDLPHGASGDLMDYDVLTDDSEYYEIGYAKTFELIGRLKDCINMRFKNYQCQVLNSREKDWINLRHENEQVQIKKYTERWNYVFELEKANNWQSDINQKLNSL